MHLKLLKKLQDSYYKHCYNCNGCLFDSKSDDILSLAHVIKMGHNYNISNTIIQSKFS